MCIFSVEHSFIFYDGNFIIGKQNLFAFHKSTELTPLNKTVTLTVNSYS